MSPDGFSRRNGFGGFSTLGQGGGDRLAQIIVPGPAPIFPVYQPPYARPVVREFVAPLTEPTAPAVSTGTIITAAAIIGGAILLTSLFKR